ncbi:hypothetical protein BH10PSE7_BH10PSE7_09520 [soil metagenome]
MKAFALAALMTVASAGMALAADPTGTWVMGNGKVTVKITKCRADALCAHIVDLKEPVYKDGTKKIDKYNPDKSLRDRPLIGLALLQGMEASGEDQWEGAIYNPDDGKTYSATMALKGSTMRVKGCVLGILCKNNDFRRVN